MSSSSAFTTGSCPCGTLRFAILAPPIITHCCHCTCCQAFTGSAFALNALLPTSELVLLPASSSSSSVDVDAADAAAAASSSAAPISENPLIRAVANIVKPLASSTAPACARVARPVYTALPTPSGKTQLAAHCPACLASVWSFYMVASPRMVFVKSATLDPVPGAAGPEEASVRAPDVHIFTRSKLPFVAIDDGKPQYEAFYPDEARAEILSAEAMQRFTRLVGEVREWFAEQGEKGKF